jgi:hypothetical protein
LFDSLEKPNSHEFGYVGKRLHPRSFASFCSKQLLEQKLAKGAKGNAADERLWVGPFLDRL